MRGLHQIVRSNEEARRLFDEKRLAELRAELDGIEDKHFVDVLEIAKREAMKEVGDKE